MLHLLCFITAADVPEVAVRAKAVFQQHCHECHGKEGRAEGGMNFILDREQLLKRGIVKANDVKGSRALRRMADADDPMPPAEVGVRPTAAEIDAVRAWIRAGAPDFNPPPAIREFVSPTRMMQEILADLEKGVKPRHRKYMRYFTLTHLYNAGRSEDDLRTYLNGFVKLLNSLSWGKRIVIPRPIDPEKTIFRVDLRDLDWDDEVWNRILAANPYGVDVDSAEATACCNYTNAALPLVRADWFVFAAAHPPLYYDILRLPKTQAELEKLLLVSVERNLSRETVQRAGFTQSGVSEHNRLIERHPTPYGFLWLSYDFGDDKDRQNLLANPVGPAKAGDAAGFRHDGGEIIFTLPNGLHGYYLCKATGERLNKGPTNIVKHRDRPDAAVENGISCFQCHAQGMIRKDDEIRRHVETSKGAYSAETVDLVQALHPPADDLAAVFAFDSRNYQQALAACGLPKLSTKEPEKAAEPINVLERQFRRELDLRLAAAELGVGPEKLVEGFDVEPTLARQIGVLRSGGVVKRDAFIEAFPIALTVLKLGKLHRFDGSSLANDRPESMKPTTVGDTPSSRMPLAPRFPFSAAEAAEYQKQYAAASGKPLQLTLKNGMKLRLVPAGKFMMGSPESEEGRGSNERLHEVTLTRGFYMGETEVTQSCFKSLVKAKELPDDCDGPNADKLPVQKVSWREAIAFCNALSGVEGLSEYYRIDGDKVTIPDRTGKGYRLPTEAEWEWSCRAGSAGPFSFNGPIARDKVSYDSRESYGGSEKTAGFGPLLIVGSLPANGFGLHEMHGNVQEWCWDGYDFGWYEASPVVDPAKDVGENRVNRGGDRLSDPKDCRSAHRNRDKQDDRRPWIGFRVVRFP